MKYSFPQLDLGPEAIQLLTVRMAAITASMLGVQKTLKSSMAVDRMDCRLASCLIILLEESGVSGKEAARLAHASRNNLHVTRSYGLTDEEFKIFTSCIALLDCIADKHEELLDAIYRTELPLHIKVVKRIMKEVSHVGA